MNDEPEQPLPVVYFPPQTRWQRLYSRFRFHLGGVKRWFLFLWWDATAPFRPHCPKHPGNVLHKGWCSSCDVEEFVREQRVRQLRS